MAPPDQSRSARILAGGVVVLLVVALLVIFWSGAPAPGGSPDLPPAVGTAPREVGAARRGERSERVVAAPSDARAAEEERKEQPEGRGTLRVRVVDDLGRLDPAAWAEALDCPGFRMAPVTPDLPPGALAYRAPLGSCLIGAVRMDGVVRTEGAPVRVAVVPGATDVELPISSARTGTLHFAYAPVPGGIRLQWLPDDSNLADAGLQRGDVILAVNGESVEGRPAEELRDLIDGDEGSPVRLLVQRLVADTAEILEELELERVVVGG